MKVSRYYRSLLSLLIAFGITATVLAEENKLTEEEAKDGWKLLFDGETTEGWRNYNKDGLSDGWKVVDGTLRMTGKAGDIITDGEFDHFEFSIDWNLPNGGNSGLMYWVQETPGPSYSTGPEIQILDKMKPGNTNSAGSCYDVYAPTKDVIKPKGEWNNYRILVKPDNNVEHWVNGELVCSYQIGSNEWNEKVANSKWKNAEGYAKAGKGHLCIQDHGANIWIRNVKIRELGNK